MNLFPKLLRPWTALAVVLCLVVLDIQPAMAGLTTSQTSGVTAITFRT